jgi:archaellum component FlaF (FlaF/FlaG flagellin family)
MFESVLNNKTKRYDMINVLENDLVQLVDGDDASKVKVRVNLTYEEGFNRDFIIIANSEGTN